MNLFDWLAGQVPSPNPDIVGTFKLTTADQNDDETKRREALEARVANAKAYIATRGLTVKPLYRVKAPA